MKQQHAAIQVSMHGSLPRELVWEGRTYRVQEVIDAWVVEGKWWEGEVRRRYFRVLTDRGTLDVYRSGEGWILAGVLD